MGTFAPPGRLFRAARFYNAHDESLRSLQMPSPIARIQFAWDFIGKSCRATALDLQDRVLARVIVELENDAVREIMAAGYIAKLRIEELAERQLRAVLALRY